MVVGLKHTAVGGGSLCGMSFCLMLRIKILINKNDTNKRLFLL